MSKETVNGMCEICQLAPDRDDYFHGGSPLHRFNVMLWEWQHYRKALVKDRNGITLTIKVVTNIPTDQYSFTFDSNKGKHIFKVPPAVLKQYGKRVQFQCILTNISNNNIIIADALLLRPSQLFTLVDPGGLLENDKYPELESKTRYTFTVRFYIDELIDGIYRIEASFVLSPCKVHKDKASTNDKNGHFTIARSIIVEVKSDEYIPSLFDSPFTRAEWKGAVNIIPSTAGTIKPNFSIPNNLMQLLLYGLREFSQMSPRDRTELQRIREVLDTRGLTHDNYKNYFHLLLWIEEAAAVIALRQYNMENVNRNENVKLRVYKHKMLELDVPGLAEKRPSIIAKDRILIRIHEDHRAFEGVIKYVQNATVIISDINEEIFELLETHPDLEMDVSFVLGRLPLERMHQGVESLARSTTLRSLFPTRSMLRSNSTYAVQIYDSEILNSKIKNNREQLLAVLNIVNCSSKKAPYIIFGPPGTGKTETLVEAIIQIKNRTKKKILVCAPANAACDMLAQKLKVFCTSKELIRVNSSSRDDVPSDLEDICNISGTNPTPSDIMKFNVVVSTLVYIGRYNNSAYHPDVIFIDEAAQALEPEADIPLALGRPGNVQIVLAGDPKQLGPSCSSRIAHQMGLGKSLLQRLMELDLYNSNNPSLIAMLITNYRSHPRILHLPNKLFYDNKLVAVSATALNDPLATKDIGYILFRDNKKHAGSPIEFCSVSSEEQREGRSPSYFNYQEVQIVGKYIKALLALDLGPETVHPTEIGVVTPYIRQVYKIREHLKKHNIENLEVGTTETFQGREKRVILISCVRAKTDLLLYDRKYQLGFVKQPNRFNVALTRAKSKLIVVGCPAVLQMDEKWFEYIELCKSTNSFYGAPMYYRRSNNYRDDVTNRFNKITRK